MSAGPWTVVNDFKLNSYKKLMDLANDALKIALVTASSNVAKTMTPATYAALTGEISAANGYSAGGFSAPNPTLSGGGATDEIDLDTDNATVTASGGSITARMAVLYDNTASPKCIIAFCLLDATNVDVVTTSGQTLTIQIAGVFGAL